MRRSPRTRRSWRRAAKAASKSCSTPATAGTCRARAISREGEGDGAELVSPDGHVRRGLGRALHRGGGGAGPGVQGRRVALAELRDDLLVRRVPAFLLLREDQ